MLASPPQQTASPRRSPESDTSVRGAQFHHISNGFSGRQSCGVTSDRAPCGSVRTISDGVLGDVDVAACADRYRVESHGVPGPPYDHEPGRLDTHADGALGHLACNDPGHGGDQAECRRSADVQAKALTAAMT